MSAKIRNTYCVFGRALPATLAVALAVAPTVMPATASAQTQTTSAPDVVDSSQVTAGISFSHAVAISAPDYHGIEPKLSVSYNVNSSVGLAGPGWTVGGFPTIERQSSFLGLPNYTAGDRLFMDGQELVSCVGPASGSPGCALGGTHVTKIESYARIVRNGETFTHCKDGICTTFQPIVCTSRGVFRWGISSVTDLLGHTTQYTWSNNNSCSGGATGTPNIAYPAAVSYHGGKYTVALFYENSVNTFPHATGAGNMVLARRVKSIDMKVLGARKSTHLLTYKAGTDVLAKIQPYGTDAVVDAAGNVTAGSTAHPAQTFTAAAPAVSFGAAALAGTFSCPSGGTLSPTDINSDGYTDFVCIDAKTFPTDNPSAILIYTNLKNGTYSAPVSVGYPNAKKTPTLADVNCDRRPDLVWVSSEACPHQWRVKLNSGNGTFSAETPWGNLPTDIDTLAAAQFSDLNNDGCSDIIYRTMTAPAPAAFRVMYGQRNTNTTQLTSTCLGPSQAHLNLPPDAAKDGYGWPLPLQFTDLDGNGAGDLLYFRDTSNTTSAEVKAVMGTGYAMNGGTRSIGLMSEFQNLSVMGFGQLANGRGTDMFYQRAGTNQIMIRPWNNGSQSMAAAQVVGTVPTGISILSLSTGDFNGDGKQDLVLMASTSATAMRPYVYLNTSAEPLLVRIDNGLGGYRKITYVNGATLPGSSNVPPQWVVRTIADSDGRTESLTQFDYANALYDPVDRRLIGFWKVSRTLPCVGSVCPRTTVYSDMDYSGARPVRIDRTDSVTNKIWHSTILRYALNAGIPYKTLLTERWDFHYASGSNALRRSAVGYTYDTYGRVATTTEFGSGTAPLRLRVTDYTPMTAATYLSKPSRNATYNGGAVVDTNKLSETRMRYNARGQLTESDVWVSPTPSGATTPYVTTSFTYDAAFRLIRTTAPLGRTTDLTYETSLGLYVATTRNPLGHQISTTWNLTCGRPSVVTGVNGETTTTTYDAFCRPTLTQNSPSGDFDRLSYFPATATALAYTRVEKPSADSFGNQWTETYLDGAGRTVEIRAKGPSTIISRSQYNAHGQVSAQSAPFYSGAAVVNTSFTYDVLGRKTATIFANGDSIRVGHFEASTCTTDEENHTSCEDVDGLGNRIRHREYDGTRWIATTFAYSPRGDLAQITDARGNVTRFTYNSIGQKISETDPATGTTQSVYNAAGELVRQTNGLGQATTFTYDALGRARTKTTRSGTAQAETVSSDYDTVVSGYRNIGQLTKETSPGGWTSYNHDPLARVVIERIHFNANGDSPPTDKTLVRRYDAGGRLVSLQFGDGGGAQPMYDAAGREHVYSYAPNLSAPVWSQLGYIEQFNAAGQPLLMHNANSAITTWTYHPTRGFLMSVRTTHHGNNVLSLTYTRNRKGMITNITRQVGTAAATSTPYTYDARDQMLSAGTQRWTYDDIGRILTSPLGAYCYPAATTAYPAPHRVTAVGSCTTARYSYDAVGNVTGSLLSPNTPTGGTRTISYNGDLKVAEVRIPTTGSTNPYLERYTYGADGSRIRKMVGLPLTPSIALFTYYLGNELELERTPASEKWTQTFSLAGRLVARRVRSGSSSTTSYLHVDHLGSVVAETNDAGAVTSTKTYMPFGQEVGQPPPSAARERESYLGQTVDATGLLYLNARYYDPALGQFISPDPQRPLQSTVGLHPYGYAFNDPINRSDVTGENPDDGAAGGGSNGGVVDAFNDMFGEAFDRVGQAIAPWMSTSGLLRMPEIIEAVNRRMTYAQFVDPELGTVTGSVSYLDALGWGGLRIGTAALSAERMEAAVMEWARSGEKYQPLKGAFKYGANVHGLVVKMVKKDRDAYEKAEMLASIGERPLTVFEEAAVLNEGRQAPYLFPFPETHIVKNAIMVQRFHNGLRLEELTTEAAYKNAVARMDALLIRSQPFFEQRGMRIDTATENFRFSREGKDIFWIDPVVSIKIKK